MNWQGEGIVISSTKLAEKDAIVKLFSKEHGLYSGVLQNAFAKNNAGKTTRGTIVEAIWQARLSEQLGTFRLEIGQNLTVNFYSNKLRLELLNSACSMLLLTLPEREVHSEIYNNFLDFLKLLAFAKDITDNNLISKYCLFELSLLTEIGYGLDLTECVATGSTEELIYISPKSAKAVSRDAGTPYQNKLLQMPEIYLQESENPEYRDLKKAFIVTSYFYDKHILHGSTKTFPYSREQIVKMVTDAC